ncbi:hypothetical protein M0811_10167 [Anaeramoeba ignava]|uniref:Uncharacterized protein n=1 Tax=Anaeramoeba ignava TaxID=1746090 RepID=A0A9Q0LGP9_ANAIG|nr:hypothetical protein M0811_10167 [Anaeramoeba ignava]
MSSDELSLQEIVIPVEETSNTKTENEFDFNSDDFTNKEKNCFLSDDCTSDEFNPLSSSDVEEQKTFILPFEKIQNIKISKKINKKMFLFDDDIDNVDNDENYLKVVELINLNKRK